MGLFDWFSGRKAPTAPVANAVDPHMLAELEKTRRPFIHIHYDTAVIALEPTASKVGGVPYVPVGATEPAPRFIFIAQVNFAEVPRLDDMPLPERGIVQFWVEDDDTYGLYDDKANERSDGNRVVFYDDVDAPQAANVAAEQGRGPLCFLDDPHGRRLRFSRESEVAPREGYDASGDKIGGYCAFTQDDPRDPADPMLSLLQLDGSDILGWGDSGIAHWFIREADLRARKFANVRYYWDCC